MRLETAAQHDAHPYRMLSAGALVDAPATLAIIDPATEQTIAHVPDCGAEQLDATVAAAQAAFADWRATPIERRRALLLALATRIQEGADVLAPLLTREQGKPLAMARREVLGCAHWCRTVAGMELPASRRTDAAGLTWQQQRVPLGVVAAIAPWNYPLLTAMMKLAPALLAGNTVVLKPSPFTPLATLRLGEMATDLFPPGVLNVLSGGDGLGPLLTAHPGIAKIAFTGSTATGRRIMAAAAPSLKHITLELGGNDAAIVLPDVDVPSVARRLFMGAFINSGQACVAAKRIYVHSSIYDAFAQAFAAQAEAARVGPGMDERTVIGPVQNRPQYERVKDLIQATQAAGHRLLAGGTLPPSPGYFIPPVVVDNPPDDARVVVEEPFGPIVPLLRYDEVDEAIRRANASEYGLGGSVWSADVERAKAIAARLETGTVCINSAQALDPLGAFAGRKQSGLGVENGVEGLLEFTALQMIVA